MTLGSEHRYVAPDIYTRISTPNIFFFLPLNKKALYMSVTLQTDDDCMVFPSKCTHLNFKLSIFRYCNSPLSLKGEASDLLIYPFPSSTPSTPHLWNSQPLYILRLWLELNLTIPCWCFKTNVHLLGAFLLCFCGLLLV